MAFIEAVLGAVLAMVGPGAWSTGWTAVWQETHRYAETLRIAPLKVVAPALSNLLTDCPTI
jgi:hypothetical protein